MELTILMPNLNEAETIGICVKKARSFLDQHEITGEVLIADNGSTDGSQEIAKDLGARVISVETRGYGAALIAGIQSAQGTYVIMGDADDSYDFSNLMPFVSELRNGADLVMGNRFQGGIAPKAMPPLHRYLGNPVLSFIGRVFYRTPIGDFHCGLRGFSRDAIQSLNLNSTGMEFASEMVLKATLFDKVITEVPTTLEPDGRTRPPHLRSWRDGWRHLKLLLSYAPNWLFLYPGITAFSLGLVLFLALLQGAITIAGVRFDIAALVLVASLVLTGAQIIIFYLLARLYGVLHRGLPSSDGFSRVRGVITVNRTSVLGGLLLLIGTLSALFAVLYWRGQGFGDLDPALITRPATLAVVAGSLGVQVATGGFLWGIIEDRL